MTQFKEQVLKIVAGIPVGSVMTYKQVAKEAGTPGAARAVGTIMKNNYLESIPCHRVIRSDGQIGKYNRGDENKRKLLVKEGYLKA